MGVLYTLFSTLDTSGQFEINKKSLTSHSIIQFHIFFVYDLVEHYANNPKL